MTGSFVRPAGMISGPPGAPHSLRAGPALGMLLACNVNPTICTYANMIRLGPHVGSAVLVEASLSATRAQHEKRGFLSPVLQGRL